MKKKILKKALDIFYSLIVIMFLLFFYRMSKPLILKDAYENQVKFRFLQIKGKVSKILKDDLKTPKHQRFLVKVQADKKNDFKFITVLIAHNIDISKRVPINLSDEIEAFGEYIYNENGGKIHYTHQTTSKHKASGYILHRDKFYN